MASFLDHQHDLIVVTAVEEAKKWSILQAQQSYEEHLHGAWSATKDLILKQLLVASAAPDAGGELQSSRLAASRVRKGLKQEVRSGRRHPADPRPPHPPRRRRLLKGRATCWTGPSPPRSARDGRRLGRRRCCRAAPARRRAPRS